MNIISFISSEPPCVKFMQPFPLTQEFQLDEMLPTDSYLARWFRDHRKQFPDSGFPGEIYAGELDYSMEQLGKLDFFVGGMERFAEEGEFVVEADFWWSRLKQFLHVCVTDYVPEVA